MQTGISPPILRLCNCICIEVGVSCGSKDVDQAGQWLSLPKHENEVPFRHVGNCEFLIVRENSCV